MSSYAIAELFTSIQGEGRQAGTPMLFLRFAGCNKHCSFCDTDHKAHMRLLLEQIVAMVVAQRKQVPFRWVCLTGGEPLLQVDEDLIRALQIVDGGLGRLRVAIETNGSVLNRAAYDADWLAIAPKDEDVQLTYASEVKLVWPDKEHLISYAETEIEASHYFLQPRCNEVTPDEATLKGTLEALKQWPRWSLSVQLHKYLGVP